MKFAPIFDIHAIPDALRKHIQPGQWVYASDKSAKGRFLGMKKNGICVVAWYRGEEDFNEKCRILRQYARG
jgi:hypothetical protein